MSHTGCETESFMAMDHFSLGKYAALPAFDSPRVFLK